jgi:hypothetical protein
MANRSKAPEKVTSSGRSPAVLGLRSHSGWAALVAVAGTVGSPLIINRRRIELADPAFPGSLQPYHAAEELDLKDAEQLLKKCRDATTSLARSALRNEVECVKEAGYDIIGCGLLMSSGRLPPTLAAILASHALIHTAEGEFYREALTEASLHWGVPVTKLKERDLLAACEAELGKPSGELLGRVTEMGRAVGSPWRQDEKYATLIAWLTLARTGSDAAGGRKQHKRDRTTIDGGENGKRSQNKKG